MTRIAGNLLTPSACCPKCKKTCYPCGCEQPQVTCEAGQSDSDTTFVVRYTIINAESAEYLKDCTGQTPETVPITLVNGSAEGEIAVNGQCTITVTATNKCGSQSCSVDTDCREPLRCECLQEGLLVDKSSLTFTVTGTGAATGLPNTFCGGNQACINIDGSVIVDCGLGVGTALVCLGGWRVYMCDSGLDRVYSVLQIYANTSAGGARFELRSGTLVTNQNLPDGSYGSGECVNLSVDTWVRRFSWDNDAFVDCPSTVTYRMYECQADWSNTEDFNGTATQNCCDLSGVQVTPSA